MPRDGAVYVVGGDSGERRAIGAVLSTAGFTAHPFPDGRCFLDEITFLRPGCLLLDMSVIDRDGANVLSELAGRLAEFPIVATALHADVAMALRALRLGASDFVERPFQGEALTEALDRTFAKLSDRVHAHRQQAEARARLNKLTQRERDVLRGLIDGLSNKALAFALGIGVRTVEVYRSNMLNRLGVRTLSAALLVAFHADVDGLLFVERARRLDDNSTQ